MRTYLALIAYATLLGVILTGGAKAQTPVAAPDRPWGVTGYLGVMSLENMGDTLNPNGSNFDDIYLGAASLSRRVARFGIFSIEVEGGAGGLFGDDHVGQVWGAVYGRFSGFPWDHYLKTSIAVSTGLNVTFDDMKFERYEHDYEGTKKLLHYFSPEITFALPERPNLELVFRLHHRSSAWGTFGCEKCGSNFVTTGLRLRF